jgi:hypothetical protein
MNFLVKSLTHDLTVKWKGGLDAIPLYRQLPKLY